MNTNAHSPAAWWLHAVTISMIVFILAPLAVVLAMSVSDSYFVSFPPHGFTLNWYAKVLHDGEFLASLRLSATLALAATAGSLLLGIPGAMALTRGGIPGASFITNLLLSPLIFPGLITGLGLLQIFARAGSQDPRVNLLVGHIVVTAPYVMRNVITSLQLVDRNLEDAARTLGAGRLQTFWRVTLPQMAPGVAAGAVFAFMISFEDYPVSMWLADAQYTPIPLLIKHQLVNVFDPSVPAMSTIVVVLALACVVALERLVGIRRAAAV
jgi:putative spermidine/putrescine transport system permease protein